MSKKNKTKPLNQPAVSGYVVERMKKILQQPEPLKEPLYNCPSTVGNDCSYPNYSQYGLISTKL